jgi:hypothetical protein
MESISEPATPELRKKVVADFVREVAEGSISLRLDFKDRRPEDIQMLSDILAKLVNGLNDYFLGLTAGEEFDFLERRLFFCITVLRTYDAFKTSLAPSKVESELQKLGSKLEDLKTMLKDIQSAAETSPKKRAQTKKPRKK